MFQSKKHTSHITYLNKCYWLSEDLRRLLIVRSILCWLKHRLVPVLFKPLSFLNSCSFLEMFLLLVVTCTLLACSCKLLHCDVPGCSNCRAVVLEMHACVGRDWHLWCLLFPPRHQHVCGFIDEEVATGKSVNTVINLLYHFFGKHKLGESFVDLHADNCSGQNNNNAVIITLQSIHYCIN